MLAEAFFWGSLLAIVYTYVLYPVWLVLVNQLRTAREDYRYVTVGEDRRGGLFETDSPRQLPTASLVVAAYNEVDVIDDKMKNSLALSYPADRFEIRIGSDGSDDGTDDRVRRYVETEPRCKLDPAPERGGKASVLNRVVPSAEGEIIVLSDANTMLDSHAVLRLVRHFDDPTVGAVCGNLRLFNRLSAEYEESLYWKYESYLKLLEGRLGAVMGANGGIYAIRKRLFRPLPPNTICDDFVIAMRVLAQGYRVVYEPAAVAYEETTEDYKKERIRRVRIAAGNFQALEIVGGLMHPRYGFTAFAFVSHKLLRWLVPFFMAFTLLASVSLYAVPLYRWALFAQVAFYLMALTGASVKPLQGRLGAFVSFARYFVEMNVGMLQGFVRYVRNTQKVTWQRTARS